MTRSWVSDPSLLDLVPDPGTDGSGTVAQLPVTVGRWYTGSLSADLSAVAAVPDGTARVVDLAAPDPAPEAAPDPASEAARGGRPGWVSSVFPLVWTADPETAPFSRFEVALTPGSQDTGDTSDGGGPANPRTGTDRHAPRGDHVTGTTSQSPSPAPSGVAFTVEGGLRRWLHVPSSFPTPAHRARVQREVPAVLTAQRTRTGGPAPSAADPGVLAASVDACLATAATAQQETVLLATSLPARGAVLAAVGVARPLDENPDYLLRVAGARPDGALGRPAVQGLPVHLQDGVSVLRYDELPGGALMASTVLARRAWQHDIVVTLRTTELQVVPFCEEPLLELLAAVQPTTRTGRTTGTGTDGEST